MAERQEVIDRLSNIPGIGIRKAEILYEAGIETPEDILDKGLSGLAGIQQISFRTAKKLLDSAEEELTDEDGNIDENQESKKEEFEENFDEEDDLRALEDLERSLGGFDELEDDLTEETEELDIEEDVEEEEGTVEIEEDEAEIIADDEEMEEDFDEEDDLKALEELEMGLGDLEEDIDEEDDLELEDKELEEEIDEEDDLNMEEEIDDEPPVDFDQESYEEDDIGYGEEEEEGFEIDEEDLDEEEYTGVDTEIESELEGILSSIDEDETGEVLPDMETAKEIDKWLEDKVGIEQHIGEESVCPVCGDVVSIYDDRCDTCGVEFASDKVKCGYCGAEIDSEMMKCPDCDNSLVDEKTVCPICDNVVYASEQICPFCGAEFDEDKVRCSECKSTVPIDSVVCPECESILRQKIIEDERGSGTGSMAVTSEETKVDVGNIQLQVAPSVPSSSSDISGGSKSKAKSHRILYPFPAIVNQEKMKRALILNAINSDIGGVLIEGQRGTAKSVAVRGLAEILPPIDVIADCRFSCDPQDPENWCWECRDKYADAEEIPVETRPVRVIDLPLNATEDRVVGTLDVEKILSEGKKSFEEGILAEVNRGILYVDEINLLDDYIVDVLLDAAAMGVVTVEREDISLSYPSDFIIIGSMNPEEGALRPQLLDRLALNVKVKGIPEPENRVKIIHRNEEFSSDPHGFRDKFADDMEDLKEKIVNARDSLRGVDITPEIDNVIAKLSVDFEVDGHRADLIMKRTAKTNAAYDGRTEVERDDLLLAAEMALPHRMRKGPLEQSEFSKERLKRLVRQYT